MPVTDADKLTPGEHIFDAGDLKLCYYAAGRGPIVVAQVPGWGVGPSYVRAAWSPLETSFTVLTFCPRGTPPSSRPADAADMSSADMASDIESLRVYLGQEQLTVVGTSNGGCIALYYASRYPERVDKLIPVGMHLIGYEDATSDKRIEEARSKEPDFVTAAALAQTAKPKSDAELEKLIVDIMPVYVVNPARDGPKFVATMQGPLSIWCSDAQDAADEKVAVASPQIEELSAIKAKTLIVHGRMDYVCPLSAAERVEQLVKGSRLLVFDRCSHMPWLEMTEEYWKEVFAFLQS